MDEKFIIKKRRKPIKGEIEVMGAKNAALPILASTLLTKEECVIRNLPLIEDVFRMIRILEEIGAEISWVEERTIKIRCREIDVSRIPYDIIGLLRGSVLILGPLLARFGEVITPPPGGCVIGVRSLDTHLDAFSQIGIELEMDNGLYHFKRKKNFSPLNQDIITFDKKKRKGHYEVLFREFSVTATENILLYFSLNSKKAVLKITDLDYQVQELIKVLRKMGAEINVSGLHILSITGKKELKGFDHTIISDPIETGTFIVLALATGSEILIKKAQLSFIEFFLKKIKDFGARFEILEENLIKVFSSKTMKGGRIQSLPYPGLHTDLQPELGVLATQMRGTTLIHDPLFEGRLRYLQELNKMGADIIFCDSHRAVITGPTPLIGIKINSFDLRAGMAFIIAGLIAEGETIIENIYQVDRGYEKIDKRLNALGFDIKRLKKKKNQ